MNKNKPPSASEIKIGKSYIRAIAHLNIGMQVVFPLALSFTPVMVARAETEEKKFLTARAPAKTIPYVLQPGDTVAGVAEKYQLTVAQLKTLNQYRTFAHGFDSLTVGDEIDVPVQAKNSAADEARDDGAALAQRVQQAGHFLQNNPNSDSAKDLARSQALGAANSKANQEVASWLNGKGKVRVKLDADRDFSLKNSELDVLYPLWESNAHQVFTQGSVHHTDSRNQSNLGVGYRYFEGTYMLGANTFFDHDWSRSHSRLGLGAEYQRDFLKVAANAYMRLTNWKNSPDFDNYEERPANGWDIRTEGYLPAYPGIGGKLVYEQYYGDRVGLFGKDNQQKDPVAVTAGVNYSPFPLMKFNVDHRMGKSNQNDTRFGIDLNYVFGAPLGQQLDSSMLAASRSLAANRYDFVERNNNIVLEYRKKESISLRLAAQISGFSGESKSLGVAVNSTNGVARIEWTAPELLSQGGQIVQVSEQQFNVIIPEYQYGNDANNSYVVSGVAYDKSGNASPKAESLVVVASAAVSTVNSTLTPMELQLPNDGHSTAELTLVLRDANNHPISGVAGDIKTTVSQSGRAQSDATVSSFSEDANHSGTYKATVTAGETMGEYKLTPEIQSIKIAPATLYVGRAPVISGLTMSGKLVLGEQLAGHYQFDSNNGNTQDTSLYQWGNKGQTAGLNGAETIVTSGSVPSYTLVASDVGQVKELSVQARNGVETLGNTATVTTVPGSDGNEVDGGGDGGTVVDETAAPSIGDVVMSGTLKVGEALSGRYTFDAKTGNTTDNSEYQWGIQGSTASVIDNGNGSAISQSGVVPSYTVKSGDAGQVLEMSVLAKNGANITGNTATVTTVPGSDGNEVDGGGDGGTVVDETAAPSISDVVMSGTLKVGEALNGRYTFDAKTGDPTDTSEYQWGIQGSTTTEVDSGKGTTISQSGVVPSYTVISSDAGQVLEVSVRAKNSANVTGNTATVTSTGSEVDGGGDGGTVVDETAAPSISDVVMSGTLEVGEALNGRYTFVPNTGNTTDNSEYQWGAKGSTASVVDNENGSAISQSGVIPSYIIQNSDVGQVLEVSVRAKNGVGMYGNSTTVDTAQTGDGNNTTGGDAGKVVGIPALKNIEVNGYSFALNSGFPTIGFKGAQFTLNIDNGSADQFDWTSDASWVSVNNGVVSFTDKGTNATVNITGTKKNGTKTLKYSFKLKGWTINNGNTKMNRNSAASYCSSASGNYKLSTIEQLKGASGINWGVRGNLGGLWNEWGAMGSYSGANFYSSLYWSSSNTNSYYTMGDLKGGSGQATDGGNQDSYVACYTAL